MLLLPLIVLIKSFKEANMFFSKKKIPSFSLLSITFLILHSAGCFAAASVSVVISAPTGSAAADFSSKILSKQIYTPCLSRTDVDALSDATSNQSSAQTALDDANTELAGLTSSDSGYAAAVTAAADAQSALTSATATLEAINQKNTIGSELIDNHFDQLTVTLNASNEEDDDGNFIYDLYVMLVDLNTSFIYLFERQQGSTNELAPLAARAFSSALSADNQMGAGDKKYLPSTQFTSSSFSEKFLDDTLYFDAYGLPQGAFMMLAILDGDNNLKLDNPSTWEYWDTDIFILGTPLKPSTTGGTSGNGICQ